jgi:hypothetical protein
MNKLQPSGPEMEHPIELLIHHPVQVPIRRCAQTNKPDGNEGDSTKKQKEMEK